ncbi:MAG: NAD-dependent protein deacetylase [Planctomycetaceae bacterium]|nr:NAD-dependent protein deacetylase [Planctomycetaceae bacterium]
MQIDPFLNEAAEALRSADALLIGAGAGMGVDSGLPDFRGNAGFWKAYPPFQGRRFSEMSTPHWFRSDPRLAWGFFGHRYNLYRNAEPHAGFQILRHWADRFPLGYFVFTSNVDGQFQRAGFPEYRVLERHGSIHYLQCAQLCQQSIWPADDLQIDIDLDTIRSKSDSPKCPRCQGVARPNILMFGDHDWLTARCEEQYARYQTWLKQAAGGRIAAIEFGAGQAIPTVRMECEEQSQVLIRVNPREAGTPDGGIPLPIGALEALTRLEELLKWAT